MKYYAQFQRLQIREWDRHKPDLVPCAPFLTDLLGTDSVYILEMRRTV